MAAVPDLSPIRALDGFERRAPVLGRRAPGRRWLRDELGRRGTRPGSSRCGSGRSGRSALLLHATPGDGREPRGAERTRRRLALALLVAARSRSRRAGRTHPLRLVFPPPRDPGRGHRAARSGRQCASILCAGYDAPRRGLVFRDRLPPRRARGRRLGPLGWLSLAALVIAAASAPAGRPGGAWLGASSSCRPS
jgi:hypothetical protein